MKAIQPSKTIPRTNDLDKRVCEPASVHWAVVVVVLVFIPEDNNRLASKTNTHTLLYWSKVSLSYPVRSINRLNKKEILNNRKKRASQYEKGKKKKKKA